MTNAETAAHKPRRVRWGLLIFLALILLFILGGILIVAGFAGLMKGQVVSVKPDSTLVLSFDRPLQEPQPDPFLTEFLKAKIYSVYGVTSALDRAAKDDRIKNLFIDIGLMPPSGFAKTQELRQAIARFKTSKKPVWAYFETASTGGYLLASSADKLYAPPTADLFLVGPQATAPFLRGTLDKLKIEPQLFHIGDYKSYSDMFTRKDMSDAQREATTAILDSLYGDVRSAIAESRKMSETDVDACVNQSFLWGEQLKEKRLVDDLWYRDQVEDALKNLNGNKEKWQRIDMGDYIRDRRVDTATGAKKKVALLLASGGIVSGEGEADSPFSSSEAIGSDKIVRILKKLGEDDQIKAVVFRVDSGGGSALASDMIWRQVQVLRKKKPVVASMSDVAASGGYYILMGTDGIVAQSGTITGSIGVVTGKFAMKGLFDMADYNQVTIKRPENSNSDMFSAYTGFTPAQAELMQTQMKSFYDVFVTKAAEGRKKTYAEVHKVAQGRIWSGQDALKIGLIDRLGGIKEAVDLAKEKAGIPKDEAVRVQVYPKPKSFLDAFLQTKADEVAKARLEGKIPPELLKAYEEYSKAQALASEPFVLYTPVEICM